MVMVRVSDIKPQGLVNNIRTEIIPKITSRFVVGSKKSGGYTFAFGLSSIGSKSALLRKPSPAAFYVWD